MGSQLGAIVIWAALFGASSVQSVTITKQPPSLTDAVEFDNVRLSVEATGTALTHLWYHNDVAVPGGTNATLALNKVAMSRAGRYYVIVSNSLDAVRSTDAVLRLVPDTFGPRILSAVLQPADIDHLYITPSEDLLRINRADFLASATNVNNYVITEMGTTDRLNVLSAITGAGLLGVRLTVSPSFDRSKDYQVCVFNVSDVRTNFIAKNSCVPVGVEAVTNVFGYMDIWSFNDSNDPPPEDWRRLEFTGTSSLWQAGFGMFHYPFDGGFDPDCTGLGRSLRPGATTYYFRKLFTLPPGIVGLPTTAVLSRVLDDGGVFYLNGTEILRVNMPAGVITHDTTSLAAGNPDACLMNAVAIGPLLARTNVLAVEVHQQNAIDPDAGFDASLVLRYTVTPALPNDPAPGTVRLNYSDQPPNELRLYWTNGFGYALESASVLSGPWQEVQPPDTNVVVTKTAGTRFYRLNKGH
jgi:hypothetical protein